LTENVDTASVPWSKNVIFVKFYEGYAEWIKKATFLV
jgi:hypothetical protein